MDLFHYIEPKFLIETLGLIGIFLIIFAESGLFFGFFLPGDSLLFTAGLFASQGHFSIVILVLGSMVAAIVGDNVGYAFGRKMGPKLFVKDDSWFFHKKHIARSQHFYEKYGKKTIILARFIPIVRTFAPIVAGVGNMHYPTFLKYNIAGGVLWTVPVTLIGYYVGTFVPNPDRYLLPLILAIIVISFLPPIIEVWRVKRKTRE